VGHVIEVFTAGCPLCRAALAAVEVGKCADCTMVERDLAAGDTANLERARAFGVRAVPTIVIDGRIKVEGLPDFPWMCSDDFYRDLERTYPLERPTQLEDRRL